LLARTTTSNAPPTIGVEVNVIDDAEAGTEPNARRIAAARAFLIMLSPVY